MNCLVSLIDCFYSLKLEKFRFTGTFSSTSLDEYQRVVTDFFRSGTAMSALSINGTAIVPTVFDAIPLGSSVMSLDFFDRLQDNGKYLIVVVLIIYDNKLISLDPVAPHGNIRGCYEDSFDGIMASNI